MRIHARAGWRGLALALGLGCALVAPPAGSAVEEPAPAPEVDDRAQPAPPATVAVLAPRTDPPFEGLRAGIREWLIERLGTAGFDLADRKRLDAALGELAGAGRPVHHGSETPALAERTGAGRVLLSELWLEGGQADLRLHLHAGDDGRVLAGARATGRVAELPALADGALRQLLDSLGLARQAHAAAGAPRLADWSALGRARARLSEGDLAAAWRELAAATGPAAERLRAEIDARAGAPETPSAMRSRLASASGRPDTDWLRVRDALRGPPDAATLLAVADAAAARGEPDRAIRLYEKVAELAPESLAAQLGRAESLAEIGRGEEAAAAFARAAELAPEAPDPHRALARLATLPPERRAQHWLRAGERQAQRFEAAAAQASFEEAGRTDGAASAAALRGVAKLHEQLGRHHEARLGYEQAAEAGDRDAEVLLGLGRTRAASEDLEGASAAFREALEKQPELSAAVGGLGQALAAQGDDAAALPQLERAVAMDPADVAVRRALARVHARRGNPEGALAVLEATQSRGALSDRSRAGLLEQAAEIRKQAGDLAGAERSLGAAVALEPDDPPLRTALATVYEAEGESQRAQAEQAVATSLGAAQAVVVAEPGAAAAAAARTEHGERKAEIYATFDALASSFPSRNPASDTPFERVLLLGTREAPDFLGQLRRWLHPKRPGFEAIDLALLEAVVELFPVEETPEIPADVAAQVAALTAFSEDRDVIAGVGRALGADAVFVARLVDDRRRGDPLWAPERPVLEVRLVGGDDPREVFILANTLRLEGLEGFTRWNLRAAGAWLATLALLLYPFVRGWGSVAVRLDYDTKGARGFFHVRLTRRAGKVQTQREKEGQSAARRWQGKARIWSRFTHSLAGNETRFRLVPARTWFVHVHGLLTDVRTKEVIGSYVEERQAKVERGRTLKLEFDLRPREAPIEVRLTQGPDGAAPDAKVQAVAALRGRPESIRYLRGGSAILQVGNGTHRVVVGVGDRVYEQQVQIEDFAGASVRFDLERDDQALFTGCQAAVDLYVNGDLPAASQALDRAGQTELANLLRAEHHRERGETDKAARYYEAAGRVQQAAELSAHTDDAHKSATLFEQAGDFGRAAERYCETGELEKAAAAYEAAFDYEAAIDCHRRAGNAAKALELLEKVGRYFEAGQEALASGDRSRAIRNLQLVDLRDPDHSEACSTLGQLFAERGDLDLAAEKLGEAVSASGESDGAPLELLERLGDLLQRAGQVERALETFETIRKRDYTYPGAAERVESLRGLRQTDPEGSAFATRARAAGAAPAAAAGAPIESRYEILAEIGRGGMGVVYQARDRRLGRSVALKRLPDNLRDNPTAVQLFLREARAAAALNHPNIVTLFDADQDEDGNYYITMEFLDGLPLDKIVAKRGRLSARDAIRLAAQIATGLHYAHEQRIVHRDIKTSNLFFTRDRAVKIMDFGLAKMLEEVRRAATVIGGTPYYMAPEQASGENVDHRADLYAFGVTLNELLTGTVPFREGDVTWHHRHTVPPDPRTRVAGLPDALAELVLQLMEKDPGARPASAAEVGDRLAAIGQTLE